MIVEELIKELIHLQKIGFGKSVVKVCPYSSHTYEPINSIVNVIDSNAIELVAE